MMMRGCTREKLVPYVRVETRGAVAAVSSKPPYRVLSRRGRRRMVMSDNALIDEVREIRHRIASECGNDSLKIALRGVGSYAERRCACMP